MPLTAAPAAEWATRPERSSMAMLRVMTWLSLNLGRRLSRVVLYGIAAYFLAFAPAARRPSREYLTRVFGRAPALGEQFRHFLAFASTIHDRIYLINDRFDLFDIALEGEDDMRAALARGGALLMGAHMGSFEVARAVGRRQPGLTVTMLMYEDNARKINAALAAINPLARQDVIALGHLESMLAVRERLDAGGVVGVLGDRTPGDESLQRVPFLGAPAGFPVGPMRMAAMLRRPVLFMAGLYQGGNRYTVHFEPLADFTDVPFAEREAAVARAIDRYAATLERHCRAAPYNWFNFHEFWR